MGGNETRDFNGFITQDGEVISIQDTERVSAIFLKTADVQSAVDCLWQLTKDCVDSGYFRAACKYIEKILPLVDDFGHKAECFLKMGQILERAEDYQAAEEAYSRAFELPCEQDTTWYFLNNNRAFCLIKTERCAEAVKFCRAAIRIEPKRYNAHKNLGLALQSLGRFKEAAKRFIRATKLHPEDARALAHLDDLYRNHREIVDEIPDFLAKLLACHERVQRKIGESPVQ
jgi:tetratricopeptide (TPR) repeat protein